LRTWLFCNLTENFYKTGFRFKTMVEVLYREARTLTNCVVYLTTSRHHPNSEYHESVSCSDTTLRGLERGGYISDLCPLRTFPTNPRLITVSCKRQLLVFRNHQYAQSYCVMAIHRRTQRPGTSFLEKLLNLNDYHKHTRTRNRQNNCVVNANLDLFRHISSECIKGAHLGYYPAV
jgi:hypothetical protein